MVAPKVVAVVRDLDLPEVDSSLSPLTEEQIAAVTELSKRWALGTSASRLVDVLAAYG